MTGFQALVIKDGNGTSQNFESYLDSNGNICGATVPTDGAGNILGLAANPLSTYSPVPSINTSSAYAHTASTTTYAFGQVWLNNATAGSVTFPTITAAKANNQAFTIIGGRLTKSGTSTTNAIFRIHLFNAAPTTAVADYGTWAAGLTLANEIGTMDFTINDSGSDISFGLGSIISGSVICSTPVSGAQTLYWVPEVRATYTPISAETLTLTLFIQ